jgi:ribosomal protein S18 acetylase RimI-like enzyme
MCNVRTKTFYRFGGSIGRGAMNQGASVIESSRCFVVETDLLCPKTDWPLLMSARLRALQDSPDAFVATLTAEKKQTPEKWGAHYAGSTWAVARDGDEVVGIACLIAAQPDDPQARFIESVWVTPEHRRRGLVREMLWQLEGKARIGGAAFLKLWVLETNDSAYDAYLKLDFYAVPDRDQDSWKSRADGTFVQERLMVKPLL